MDLRITFIQMAVLSFAIAMPHFCVAQNLISNPDFESYSNCPNALGDLNAISWKSAIANSDYYSCGFRDQFNYPTTDTTAFSGSAYIGFASYGDATGSAEAVKQALTTFLLPGHQYKFSYAVKKAVSGLYATVCGGLQLYGSKLTMPDDVISAHVADDPGSVLLGETDSIQNTEWISAYFTFTPVDTIKNVALTISKAPLCTQNLFVDSVGIFETPGPLPVFDGRQISAKIYPVPANGACTILYAHDHTIENIQLLAFDGRQIPFRILEKSRQRLVLGDLPPGMFILILRDDMGNTFTEKIVSAQ